MTTQTVTGRRGGARAWFARDFRRSMAAAIPACLLLGFQPSALLVPTVESLSALMAVLLVLSVLYVLLTCYAFGRARGERLAVLLRGSERRRSGWRRYVELGSGPVAWSLMLAGFSLFSGVTAARLAGSEGGALLAVLAILLVAGAWATMVTAYAVRYARTDAMHGGLDFPGPEDERTFQDYVYLSVAASAAFATSDVSVTTRRQRRSMIGHSIIAFAFSTVVLATVITLI